MEITIHASISTIIIVPSGHQPSCQPHLGVHAVAPLEVHQDVPVAVLHLRVTHGAEEVLGVHLQGAGARDND